MKNEIATNPAYRKVVAALDHCEKRYDSLIKRTGATNDLRLASTVALLKGEVEQRRRLELDLLAAVETERQRIGQDLHDDLCQRLGAIAQLGDSHTLSSLRQVIVPKCWNRITTKCDYQKSGSAYALYERVVKPLRRLQHEASWKNFRKSQPMIELLSLWR